MPLAPRILIAEGNPSDRRVAMLESGGALGSSAYTQSLKHICPDAKVDVIFPADKDQSLPRGATFTDYDGFVLGGSALNLPSDGDDPKVTRQIELARAAFKSKIPFLGSCWGLQVAAAASGGVVGVNPRGREIGLARKVTLTTAGRAADFFEGKSAVFDSPAIHLDEVTHLPAGSLVLAENAHTGIQAAIIRHDGGTFWGMQYHPEFDLAHMAGLVRSYADMLRKEGFYESNDAAHSHALQMDLLHQDPNREDLSWLLGVDRDVLNPDVRLREISNWVDRYVMPRCLARG